ncbi:MAG: phage coat protein [Oscillospiraceae bacterium]|nr:phage coat protein [Oscillospiraceae bacterium]
MGQSIFDNKIWNPQVFDRYRERVPLIRTNAILTSGAFRRRNEWASKFVDQTGGNRATVPYKGILGGDVDNYDGVTNMSSDNLDTFSQDITVIGRMKGWQEKDFTMSVTGEDFVPEIASQVNEYYDNVNISDILAILKGMFGMLGALDSPFVTSHTHDISGEAGEGSRFNETTIITASQKAAGQNMNSLTLAWMHSFVVANLTKIAVVEYMKYTDINGFTRNAPIATVNGRTVIMDDRLYDANTGNYTSYLLGDNAFDYTDLPVKNPSSTSRDEEANGGIDKLHTRQRKIYAPKGISYTQVAQGGLSPTASELALGVNWEVIKNSDRTSTIDLRSIPIARIISKG